MLNAKLVVVGGAKETEIELKQLPLTIGRAREATITLPHTLVSRKHCEISEQDGLLFVKDLNSLNGTFLNNEQIGDPRPLLPNQLLTLGNVTFRALYDPPEHLSLEQFGLGADSVGSITQDWQHGETIPVESHLVYSANQPSGDSSISDSSIGDSSHEGAYEEEDTDERKIGKSQHQQSADPAAESGEGLTGEFAQFEIFDDEPKPDHSVSLGEIAKLPDERQPAASFTGQIIDDDQQQELVEPDQFSIDLGADADQESPSQSGIDSFIRRLPK